MQIDLFQILAKYAPQTRAGKIDDSNFPVSERSLSITKMQQYTWQNWKCCINITQQYSDNALQR